MNKMNTLAFVNFLLVKLFPTLIRQNFPPSKICAIRYSIVVYYCIIVHVEMKYLPDELIDHLQGFLLLSWHKSYVIILVHIHYIWLCLALKSGSLPTRPSRGIMSSPFVYCTNIQLYISDCSIRMANSVALM